MTLSAETTAAARRSTSRIRRERFVFAGVGFEIGIRGCEESPLNGSFARTALSPAAGAGIRLADVRCEVTLDRTLALQPGRSIQWRWNDGQADLWTHGVAATVRRMDEHRYACTARVGPGNAEVQNLVNALAACIVDREGGLLLHAAGIDFQHGAVLFTGPSGAGKTTACNHASSARFFTTDRVALIPKGPQWLAWRLPGGSEGGRVRPDGAEPVLPLYGILRVHQAKNTARIEDLALLEAMVAIRESLMAHSPGAGEETALLDRVGKLASSVQIGRIHTVLGQPTDTLVREWLLGRRAA